MNAIDKKVLELNARFVPAVVGFCLKEDQILMGLRKKVSMNLGENLIAGIGGKVGDEEAFKNETHEEAMIREAEEEIGIKITGMTQIGRIRHINVPEKSHYNMDITVFLIEEWEGEPVETDVIKPIWFHKDELPFERMWEAYQFWIPKVLAGKNVNALFLHQLDSKIIFSHFEE
ncbi:MAG: 8-oxo-dGTP diphosphatase [Candidatus Gracilibacteria bacterium]